MVFDLPTPLPMSIFDNVAYGPRLSGTTQKKRLMEIVEKALKSAVLWEEVKDRLRFERPTPLRRATAASLPGTNPGPGTGGPPSR